MARGWYSRISPAARRSLSVFIITTCVCDAKRLVMILFAGGAEATNRLRHFTAPRSLCKFTARNEKRARTDFSDTFLWFPLRRRRDPPAGARREPKNNLAERAISRRAAD